MNLHDRTYIRRLEEIKLFGKKRTDRTGTGTTSRFSETMSFDIWDSFPLLTSKRIPWKAVVHELLWFLKGDTNVKYLQDNGVTIWNEWADDNGDLGPVYGAQWRNWQDPEAGSIDQIAELIANLKKDPFSRRHIVSAWNPGVLPDPKKSPRLNAALGNQALPPCHTLFQFYVEELDEADRKVLLPQYHNDLSQVPTLGLSCQLYQRSADMFLGVPFNIASYSLLTYLVAKTVDMHPMEFYWVGGDCHIYSNHEEQIEQQITRYHDQGAPTSPTVKILNKRDRLEDYTFEDIQLNDYNPLSAIKAPIAV